MPERAADWLRQAERDLEHAHHALEDGDYEWAAFAAQQAADFYTARDAEQAISDARAILDVDVFPYTRAELERMLAEGNPFIRRALAEGIELFPGGCQRRNGDESGDIKR